MKIGNIALGDSVQVKKSLCHSEFKAKQVCEVIDIDLTDKHGFDVLIQGKNCLDWVNHKYLKKPEPKLKQLDQSVFNGLDEKWKSAATNTDGKAYLHNMPKSMMCFNHSSYGWCSKDYDAHEMQLIGDGFDPSGFVIGFIERDIAKDLLEVDLSSELTGSDLCKAMLARGDKFVMCAVSMADDETALSAETVTLNRIVISLDKEWLYTDTGTRWHYAVPINNQGEPLTAAEVEL